MKAVILYAYILAEMTMASLRKTIMANACVEKSSAGKINRKDKSS